ncbi:hypothetical protein [Xenorhabdus lircayensis]|uniref:Uncharacterized protein n=1 Tax=Xenorhabdus lircayensis TaxID=2763499 RepID=A0ABS0U7K2_9GAMM|nr:hypothetical protein [Xenorhabdus lircayensis]MBI6549489.1 hypothetical protein [Xenorhabdus lircayensis]
MSYVLLPALIFPQARNCFLDKSKIQGDIEVKVPPYDNLSKEDKLYIYFGSHKSEVHTMGDPSDPAEVKLFFSFYFNKNQFSGDYVVTYNASNYSSIQGRDSFATNIIIIGSDDN